MPSAARPCFWSPMKSSWRDAASACCGWPMGRSSMPDLRLALRLARRELRGGFAGFRIFFLCLMLGAAAIAGVESLSDAFLAGLQDQGRILLGGDVAVRLVHRPASAKERAFLQRQGTVSE